MIVRRVSTSQHLVGDSIFKARHASTSAEPRPPRHLPALVSVVQVAKNHTRHAYGYTASLNISCLMTCASANKYGVLGGYRLQSSSKNVKIICSEEFPVGCEL
jgi:hypothetical protein